MVETNILDWLAGDILLPKGEDSKLQLVAYCNCKYSVQECNYDIYNKELFMVIKALEEWRPKLEDSSQQFDIIMNHKHLYTFTITKRLLPLHIQWVEFLLYFNFKLIYHLDQ
jgi:hypothetical protein